MKENILNILQCPNCGKSDFLTDLQEELYNEWREGSLTCRSCQHAFSIKDGIGDFLTHPSAEVTKEIEGAHAEIRIKTKDGESFLVDDNSIEKFSDLFLSMPEGDGSYYFKDGGCFQNFAEGAHRFYDLIDGWGLKPGMKVLDIGTGFCWSSREFVKRNCDVVAIDIVNYLKIADLYLKRGIHFERLYADMDLLPFQDESFDIVFAAAAIHHSSDMPKTFRELSRVLKKGGRVILLNECFIGHFEKAQVHDEDFAFNDHYYPVNYWRNAMAKAGFKSIRVDYLSFLKDYVGRKEARGAKSTLKLKIAKKIIQLPLLDRLISLLSVPIRMAFRPKSVLLQATKPDSARHSEPVQPAQNLGDPSVHLQQTSG